MTIPNTRDHLIDIGLQQIHSTGYTATGVKEILDLAGVPKGSFYHYFSSKEAFTEQVLTRYATTEGERLQAILNNWEGALVRMKADKSAQPLHTFLNFTFNVLLKQ